jgi:hypothetical protein
LPLTDTNPQNGERGQQALNSVDYNPLLRALLVWMDRWVSQGEEPPPSRYPRLADGSAVAPEKVRGVVTAIPGVRFPAHPPQVTRLDFLGWFEHGPAGRCHCGGGTSIRRLGSARGESFRPTSSQPTVINPRSAR